LCATHHKFTLLPFKGHIVYDGLVSSYKISFGPGIRRSLNENFKEAVIQVNGFIFDARQARERR